jgi:hypothetical protein
MTPGRSDGIWFMCASTSERNSFSWCKKQRPESKTMIGYVCHKEFFKKFLVFYGNQKLISALTRANNWTLA